MNAIIAANPFRSRVMVTLPRRWPKKTAAVAAARPTRIASLVRDCSEIPRYG
jgi:hypothetical protein